MNPYNSLLENANFSVKTSNEKITSINSQVIVILDGIICFFYTILRYFTVSVKNTISGLLFRKQKGTSVFH